MNKPNENPLASKPVRFRALPARGLKSDAPKVERDGGDRGAGLIRGMAVVTRGEALGHGNWIDSVFLDQVAAAMNASPGGVKSRFTHPGLSADGMGKFLGRVKNGRRDGDVVRGDEHFSQSAHDTPDGDLAGYVMDLAEEDPEAFGTSIVFLRDREAETRFMLDNGATIDGNWVDDSTFKSPDPDNVGNLPHVRLAELLANDVVDDPAANPSGLFRRGQEIAEEADSLLEYSLGLSPQAPALSALDVDPDRLSGFITRFLDSHGLELKPKEQKTMADETTTEPEETKPESPPVEPAAPVDEKPAEQTQQADPRAEVKRYIKAFGAQGAEWYADGVSYEDAKDKYIEQLKAERDQLAERLKSINRGETEPARFDSGDKDRHAAAKAKYSGTVGDGLAVVAAANEAAMTK